MADVRPFRALRYNPSVVPAVGAVLAPPFDVIDADEQAALHGRSPHNAVRLELAEGHQTDRPGRDRYSRAADTLRDWRNSGVLPRDDRPAFYVYVQEFQLEGKRRRRTAFFARLRLEPWEAGVVRPHEETMSGPKKDRLQLLRHLRTNVSPVFVLYRDPEARIHGLLSTDTDPVLASDTPDGERHELYSLDDPAITDEISLSLRDEPLYIADGHHRYETALAYRDERRALAAHWTGDEPENFLLVALTAAEDPALMLRPTHRLVRPPVLSSDLTPKLGRLFHVEDTTPKSYDGTALIRLQARLTAARESSTAFGALGLEEGRLHLLALRDSEGARALMPGRSPAWQALDANVLEYAVLRDALGIDTEAQGAVGFTDDAERAMREVETGRWPLAFLLNETTVDQLLAVADAGERMPKKSTFFYPKLPTGLVFNSFD